MIKIKYQLYGNDFTRVRGLTECFSTIEELNNWIVKNYYYYEYYCMGDTHHSHIGYYGDRISFPSKTLMEKGNFYGYRYIHVWIEQIENENGIIYSNGEYTQGVRHISKELEQKFEEWRKEDKEDPKHLKRLGFKFID